MLVLWESPEGPLEVPDVRTFRGPSGDVPVTSWAGWEGTTNHRSTIPFEVDKFQLSNKYYWQFLDLFSDGLLFKSWDVQTEHTNEALNVIILSQCHKKLFAAENSSEIDLNSESLSFIDGFKCVLTILYYFSLCGKLTQTKGIEWNHSRVTEKVRK